MGFIGTVLRFSFHFLFENIHIYFLSFTVCMEIWKYGNLISNKIEIDLKRIVECTLTTTNQRCP
jgi:hypothetical protein